MLNHFGKYCLECDSPPGMHEDSCTYGFTTVKRMRFSSFPPPAYECDLSELSDLADTQEMEAAR